MRIYSRSEIEGVRQRLDDVICEHRRRHNEGRDHLGEDTANSYQKLYNIIDQLLEELDQLKVKGKETRKTWWQRLLKAA